MIHIEQCPCGRAKAGCEYHDIPKSYMTDVDYELRLTPDQASSVGIYYPGQFLRVRDKDKGLEWCYIVRTVHNDGSVDCTKFVELKL